MRRTSLSILALVAAGALALGGCSGPAGTTTGGTGTGTETSGTGTSLPLADLNIQPRDSLETGGQLRFAISVMPSNWNPMNVDGNTVAAASIWDFVGPTNWDYADDASITPNTNYVESYDVTDAEGDNPQVVTLHLNPDAKWNSGRTIDYTDYVASWQACNGTQADFNCASTDGWNQIASVEQGDTATDVVVTYNSSYPDWSATLSSVYPAEGVSDAETFNNGWAGPDGFHPEWHTGPFAFSSYNEAQLVLTLERNDAWWGDPALLDTVTFSELQNPADVQAFANNEVDVVENMIDANSYQQVQARTGGAIRTAGGRQWRHFTMNTETGNLTDVRIRQAIQMATNREAIAQSDLAGLPVDPASLMLGNHFFMPGQEGYVDNSGDFAYDPEAAGALLDEAGWTMPEGGTVREMNGQPLTIDYAMLTGVATSENEGRLLQTDLAAVGIQLNLVNTPAGDFNNTLINGTFGIIAFTWQGTPYPMANVRQIYGAAAEGSTEPSDSNFARLVNPEIEELIPQIETEADHDTRVDLTNQADKLIWESGHTLPIYRRQAFTAVPENLANYGAATFASTRVEDIGYTAS